MNRARLIGAALSFAVASLVAACGGGGPTPTFRTNVPTVNPVFLTPAPTTTAVAPLPPGLRKTYKEYPPMTIDVNKTYKAVIDTEKGEITIELYPKQAPKTVNNFVFLAREQFYDGLTFHRVLQGFVAQGGDPLGTGRGGPGYNFEDEIAPGLAMDEGIVAMANSGVGTRTNGSQFFITLAPQPQLNGKHTIFGKVVSGMDVVKQLKARDPDNTGGSTLAPGDRMVKVTIQES